MSSGAPSRLGALVDISVPGTFHAFHLAKVLHDASALGMIYSATPLAKARGYGLPTSRVATFPYLHIAYLGIRRAAPTLFDHRDHLERLDKVAFDAWVSRRRTDAAIHVGWSGAGLITAKKRQAADVKYVCDRGAMHISRQNELLLEEATRWDFPFKGISESVIDRELEEYSAADHIVVPSRIAKASFSDHGIPLRKVSIVPYGVEIQTFSPGVKPDKGPLQLVFAGNVTLQKGIPYLLEALRMLPSEDWRLWIAGVINNRLRERLSRMNLLNNSVHFLGPIPQFSLADLLARTHALVLPSVQDGFGMVVTQAMASGCVPIVSTNAGASDLIVDGVNGFTVPPRDSNALAIAIDRLIGMPRHVQDIGHEARKTIEMNHAWTDYGQKILEVYRSVLSN